MYNSMCGTKLADSWRMDGNRTRGSTFNHHARTPTYASILPRISTEQFKEFSACCCRQSNAPKKQMPNCYESHSHSSSLRTPGMLKCTCTSCLRLAACHWTASQLLVDASQCAMPCRELQSAVSEGCLRGKIKEKQGHASLCYPELLSCIRVLRGVQDGLQ